MPFPQQQPRILSTINVEKLRPEQFGCYGLLKDGIVIYIGKGDIRLRLLSHLHGDNPCIAKHRPKQWIDVVTPDFDNEEKLLLLEYDPQCNKVVG
jgi:hypothetical protein